MPIINCLGINKSVSYSLQLKIYDRLGMDPSDRVRREQWLRGEVLAGNEEAWRTWYEESFRDLRGYACWRCGGRCDQADDIVQETWLTAVRRMRQFNPRQGSFISWLRGIAANLARNDSRKRGKLPKIERPADDGLEDNGHKARAENRRRETRIADALDALSEREEAALRAKYIDGLSVAEIASNGGETPKAVESLLSRARRAFRDVYNNGENEND